MSRPMTISEFESMFLSLSSDQRAYVPLLWRGPVGIGKTASFKRLAQQRSLTFAPLEFAHCAEEDAGGIPVRDEQTGQVVRLPIGPIRLASQQPSLLFLDEVSRANEVKQGALLTLINERRAGDFALHPSTIVALAANGTSSTGAFKLIGAMMNRIVIVDALPSLEEVYAYLRTLGGDADPFEVALRDMAIDWAATAERTPQLVQIEPPPGVEENGEQHPSPRMCEKAVRGMAKLQMDGMPVSVLRRFLEGAVSAPVSNAYFAVRSLRDNLPTAKEICDDPKGAKLPSTIETAVAAMALVEQAGLRDHDAAWIYANRMKQDDIRVALGKRLTSKIKAVSPEAIKARIGLVASQATAVRSAM
jgi:hypothetical protein